MVLAAEELHPHNGKDEPEDETHEQHVHDGGNGTDQGVHHHLGEEGEEEGLEGGEERGVRKKGE